MQVYIAPRVGNVFPLHPDPVSLGFGSRQFWAGRSSRTITGPWNLESIRCAAKDLWLAWKWVRYKRFIGNWKADAPHSHRHNWIWCGSFSTSEAPRSLACASVDNNHLLITTQGQHHETRIPNNLQSDAPRLSTDSSCTGGWNGPTEQCWRWAWAPWKNVFRTRRTIPSTLADWQAPIRKRASPPEFSLKKSTDQQGLPMRKPQYLP